MRRPAQPDFLIIGAPKAGTTALHAALSQHPDVFVTNPKEPKYWLCDDAPPPAWRGPGDAHSQREWIWRRHEYERLFQPAAPHQLRGESTPFYLWSLGAHRRIAEALPEVRLIAVVRDPIDRAYSNWMHLWSDGLEPVGDFEKAFALQDDRIRAGWAPFWRYRGLGRYGEQLEHLYRYVDRERVLVLRYRDIVDEPTATVDRASRFLGISAGPRGADPARQLAQLRGAGVASARLRPAGAIRGPTRGVRSPAGLAPSQHSAHGRPQRLRRVPPTAPLGRAARPGCCPASPRTSTACSRSPAMTSGSGCRPRARGRSGSGATCEDRFTAQAVKLTLLA